MWKTSSRKHLMRIAERKIILNNEYNLRDSWDNIIYKNIRFIEVPEVNRREQWIKNLFE